MKRILSGCCLGLVLLWAWPACATPQEAARMIANAAQLNPSKSGSGQ